MDRHVGAPVNLHHRLRVVAVTHYFPTHGGGIERVANDLARSMLEAGSVEIEWFASDCDAPPPAAPHFSPRPVRSWNGLEVRGGPPYPVWPPSGWAALWRSIRRCDVVHVHDYVYMGSLMAWAMAKLARRPVLVTQHVGNVPFPNKVLAAVLKSANASLGRLVLNGSSAVVFVSEHVRGQFFSSAKRHVHHIPNGVDTTIYHPLEDGERERVRSRLGIEADRPVFLFAGRFVAKKGLHLLERLVDAMPQVRWIFAGRGPLDPEAWGQPAVRVFRDRSGSSLAELYQAADLLVLPSAGEGFPLVIQEALACGTPVLAGAELSGALPGIDHVLMTEEVSGADAAARWQARLQILLQDTAALSARRQEAAEFAAANWAWRRCAEEYFRQYKQVMQR